MLFTDQDGGVNKTRAGIDYRETEIEKRKKDTPNKKECMKRRA